MTVMTTTVTTTTTMTLRKRQEPSARRDDTFGFGLLDALKFIDISERWPSVIGEQRHCKLDWPPKNTPYSELNLVNLVNNHDEI